MTALLVLDVALQGAFNSADIKWTDALLQKNLAKLRAHAIEGMVDYQLLLGEDTDFNEGADEVAEADDVEQDK